MTGASDRVRELSIETLAVELELRGRIATLGDDVRVRELVVMALDALHTLTVERDHLRERLRERARERRSDQREAA